MRGRAVTDQPRFVRRGLGYTSDPSAAVDRLEAVGEAEQRRQTAESHRRARLQRREEWASIRAELLGLAGRVRALLGPSGSWAQRDLARVADRLDRQLRS